MNYELIDLDVYDRMPTIQDDEISTDFDSDFIAYFENGNEDEDIRIEGNVYFDIEIENVSYDDYLGRTYKMYEYCLEGFAFTQVKIFINDVKVSVPQEEYQSLFNEIENNIINLFECN